MDREWLVKQQTLHIWGGSIMCYSSSRAQCIHIIAIHLTFVKLLTMKVMIIYFIVLLVIFSIIFWSKKTDRKHLKCQSLYLTAHNTCFYFQSCLDSIEWHFPLSMWSTWNYIWIDWQNGINAFYIQMRPIVLLCYLMLFRQRSGFWCTVNWRRDSTDLSAHWILE